MTKKFNKIKICSIPLFIMLFALAGCSYKNKNYTDNHSTDDHSIANNDSFSCQNSNFNVSDDGKSFFAEIGNLDGHFELAKTDVQNDCDVEIYFSGNIKSGKAKLVLVKPDASVEILKEMSTDENNSYEENLRVSCDTGINKIKIVGENYSGSFEITQNNNRLFNYTIDNMFDESFPFNSKD